MHQFCLQAIYRRDYTNLKEIMLKFNYFLEISQELTDSQFTYIISKLQAETIIKHQPLYLNPANIYFFFEKGAVYNQQRVGKSEKSIRIRQKNRHLTSNNKMIQKLPDIKETIAYQIDQFDSFQEKTYSTNKNVYYCFTSKPTIAIRLPLSDLSQDYQQLLKNHISQKVKFLAQYGSSLNLEKHQIIENIHKFRYLTLSFGQCLYNKLLRNQHICFLKNGVVEINQGVKNKNKCIVNAKSVIGIQTTDQESARSMSHRLECYMIKKEFLHRHFFKFDRNKQLLAQSTCKLMSFYKTGLNTPHADKIQLQISQNKQLQSKIDKSCDSSSRQRLNRGRNGHSSLGILKQKGQQKCRLFKLKQHFSNFYNEVFEEYFQRKMQHMGLKLDNKENLVLYNIKVLQRKAPDMGQIKLKLNKIRLDKMRACKQKLKDSRHQRELTFTQIVSKKKNQ